MYDEKLRSLIKLGVLGVIGGLLFGFFSAKSDGADMVATLEFMFVFSLAFAGFPYGLIQSWKALRGIIPLNLFTLIIYAMFVLIAAIMVGAFIYPIVLLYTAIQYFRYKKKEEILYNEN